MPDTIKKTSTKQAAIRSFVAGADPLAVGPSMLVHLPAELVGVQPEPPVYDPKEAEALLAAHLPRLKAIPSDRLNLPRVDIDVVGRALLGVVAFTRVPAVHAIFEGAAAAGQFDLTNLERLGELTLVLIHVFRKAESAGAFKTSAKVPAELDAESLEVEKRIQGVCEDFFPNDPLVILLRPGIGYVDRAYDLLGYADIYEKNAAQVAGHIQYRATDMARARALAGRLLAAIDTSMNPAQQVAFDQLRRAWTLVTALYFEVRSVGLAGLRYDPAKDERFPSVYSIGRKGVGRKRASKEAAAVAGGAGGGAAAAAGPADK